MYNGAGHISLRDAGVDIGYLELLGASLSWWDLLSPPHRSCDSWCPTGAANGHQPARNNDLKTQLGGTTGLCVMLGGGEPFTFPMEPSEGDSRTEDKHNHTESQEGPRGCTHYKHSSTPCRNCRAPSPTVEDTTLPWGGQGSSAWVSQEHRQRGATPGKRY